jgi:hypothetical protein
MNTATNKSRSLIQIATRNFGPKAPGGKAGGPPGASAPPIYKRGKTPF